MISFQGTSVVIYRWPPEPGVDRTGSEVGSRKWYIFGGYGPQERVIPVNQLMPAALAAVLRRAPLTPEKVSFSWRTAVGPAVDNVTAVSLHDGVLYVRARDEAWRREIERSAALIRARLDGLLGEHIVRRIEVARR